VNSKGALTFAFAGGDGEDGRPEARWVVSSVA
jgi:hypothetical protein